MIRRIMTIIAALLIAWLGLLASQPVAAAVPAHAEPTYAHDGHRLHADVSAHPITERGPPFVYADDHAQVAVDLLSHGTIARQDGLKSRIHVTDATTKLAALGMTTPGTTSGHAAVVDGACRALELLQIAANAGSKLLPTVDKAFQFPGAGRSGAGVKNFVGPPNTIAGSQSWASLRH